MIAMDTAALVKGKKRSHSNPVKEVWFLITCGLPAFAGSPYFIPGAAVDKGKNTIL